MTSTRPAPGPTASGTFARTTITLVMTVIAALAFAFSFGNVWALARRLGVPHPVAPLIAPMVDLSVVGLLVALHHLAATGTDPAQLRSATRLMHLCGLLTVALNTAEPILAEHYGRAALDTVAPALLLGWGAVGPTLLRHLHPPTIAGTDRHHTRCPEGERSTGHAGGSNAAPESAPEPSSAADTAQDQPTGDETVVGPGAEMLPAVREPAVGRKRTGRRPAASLDELAEIVRPAVEEYGATHTVIRTALREAGTSASNERIGVLVQRFKDAQPKSQQTELAPPDSSPHPHAFT